MPTFSGVPLARKLSYRGLAGLGGAHRRSPWRLVRTKPDRVGVYRLLQKGEAPLNGALAYDAAARMAVHALLRDATETHQTYSAAGASLDISPGVAPREQRQ